MQILYLFEYDGTEEAMILRCIFQSLLISNQLDVLLAIKKILWYIVKNMFLCKCYAYKTACQAKNTIDLAKNLINIWEYLESYDNPTEQINFYSCLSPYLFTLIWHQCIDCSFI